MLSVDEAQYAGLDSGHVFLDDNPGACCTESASESGIGGFHRLLHRLSHGDALSQSQSVGLDDDGRTLLPDIGASGRCIVENGILRRRNMIPAHEILGKALARLDDRGIFMRAERADAHGLKLVHESQRQRIVGRYEDEIRPVLTGKGNDARNIGGLKRHAFRQGRNASVSGCAPDMVDLAAHGKLPDKRMLSAASADNENVH